MLLALFSLFTGEYQLTGHDEGWRMLWITRWPRTASLILSGIAMAMSGLVMQLMSQNRFVDASTSGTLEWSSLGILLAYVLFKNPTIFERMTLSIVMAFVGTLIFYKLLQNIRLEGPLMVPIVGMMIGAVISALVTFMSMAMGLDQVVQTWFVASFSSIEMGRYEYLWLILGLVLLLYLFADRLTLASLGEETATSLGLSYQSTILVGVCLVAFAVGLTSAVIGQLPFVGLIVPNLVSLYRGDHLRSNLPWVCLCGAGIMLVSDILSRILIRPFEVPVSILLSIFGAIVFTVLLFRKYLTKGG